MAVDVQRLGERMSGPLDLDKRRAEANEKPLQVKLGGIIYDLPARLPTYALVHINEGRFNEAVRLLFGPEHEEAVAELLAMDDLLAILAEYGAAWGEAAASFVSSQTNGAPSKPISPVTTAST